MLIERISPQVARTSQACRILLPFDAQILLVHKHCLQIPENSVEPRGGPGPLVPLVIQANRLGQFATG